MDPDKKQPADPGNDDEREHPDIEDTELPDTVPEPRDRERANELAKEAYGDEDDDGRGDVPHVPLPG